MARSRIESRRTTEGVIFTYRLPAQLLAVRAWWWSALGGLAIGVGAAVTLLIAGAVTGPGRGWLTFRAALLLGAVIGTLLVYGAAYWPAARRRMLSLTFDRRREEVLIRRTDLLQSPARFAFEDVIAFRLVDQPGGRQGCVLVMETASAGDFVLLLGRHACYEDAVLSQFAATLHGYLDTLFSEHNPDPVPPPSHVSD